MAEDGIGQIYASARLILGMQTKSVRYINIWSQELKVKEG